MKITPARRRAAALALATVAAATPAAIVVCTGSAVAEECGRRIENLCNEAQDDGVYVAGVD